MTTAKTQNATLLEGPLFSRIVRFVLPLICTNLLQMVYNAADMIVVGMSPVEGALGAIGTTGAMIALILNIFIGFSVGANVVVARWIGAGEEENTRRAVHTALCTAVFAGVIGCVLGQIVCRPILVMLGDEGHILELAVLYSRIYFFGAPFMSVTNFCIAILRAKGDTKTPLYVLSVSGLCNVVLNLFFVLFCDMSVDGVSLATALSNLLSAVILVVKLAREESWCRFEFRRLRIHVRSLLDILYVGIPAAVQSALFSVSNMTIQSAIIGINNTMYPGGSAVIDGNAAGSNLEGFCYTATNSVHQAAVTFTSQHYGAGKLKRIASVMKNCYLISCLVAIFCAGGILLFQKPLLGLYVDAPGAFEAALIRNKIMLTTYFLLAFMEIGTGLLRGLGKSVTSTVISLFGACVFRVLWINFVFPAFNSLQCIYISYPISWALTTVVSFVFFVYHWKKAIGRQESLCA